VVIELNWQKKSVNNTFIEADWLKILVDKGENKITSFKLNKYDFAAAYLDTSALVAFLTGMKTRMTTVEENECVLRLACKPTLYLVQEKDMILTPASGRG